MTVPSDRAASIRAGRRSPPRRAAFTLVELLVVIAIIILLVGILVPAVQAAIRRAEVAQTMVRIADLSAACGAYENEHGYYPGQQYIDQLGSGSSKTTGSQWLAKALFGHMANPGGDGKMYAGATLDDLITPADGLENSISDQASNPRAILYYPAELGASGLGQYHSDHNVEYITGNGDNSEEFSDFIKDARFGSQDNNDSTTPPNPGAFMMFAAGMDGKYLTGDDLKFPDW